MSNTWHHGDKSKERLFGLDNWRWWYANPKDFRKMYKHKPQRGSRRLALHKVMKGQTDTLFPLDRKPKEYYW